MPCVELPKRQDDFILPLGDVWRLHCEHAPQVFRDLTITVSEYLNDSTEVVKVERDGCECTALRVYLHQKLSILFVQDRDCSAIEDASLQALASCHDGVEIVRTLQAM